MSWDEALEELAAKRRLAYQMGGPEGVERQHSQGRLTIRERIDLLVDPGSFQEIQTTMGEAQYGEDGTLLSFRPGNVVAGFARLDGRPVALRGDDFTIRGGSTDAAGTAKRSIERSAMNRRIPLVRLLEGAGGSVREVDGRTPGRSDGQGSGGTGDAVHAVEPKEMGVAGSVHVPDVPDFQDVVPMARGELALWAQGNLHAQVPVVSAVLGSCAGWIAIAAVDSHFSVMLRDSSELFVGGPPLVKAALGIEIDKRELGNYRIHVEETGVIHNVAVDEADALDQIRAVLSYLPQSVWQLPPRSEPEDDPNRRDEELRRIVPANRRQGYDVHRVIELVVDRDSAFEIQPLFGRSLVTMLARMDGLPVALLANDCRFDGGAMTAAACQKFERFVDFADMFHLPIVYLCDVPGFMIGPDAEHQGTLRWALKANIAVHEATTPYFTILLRRFYGVAMEGAKSDPGLNVRYAWPSAESGSLPAAGGVMAAYRRVIEAAPDPEAMRLEIEERINTLASVLRRPTMAEEIIDPRDTRPLLCELVRSAYSFNATQLGPKIRVGMRR